jgi:hypothetical protein
MNWYLAKIVFQIVCGEGCHTPQFDEQLRLICATDECAAICKAQGIGHQEEDSFFNQQQKLVQWRFVNIAELYCLSQHMDGAEIFSRIIETYNGHDFVSEINKKAVRLQQEMANDLVAL